MRTTPAEDPCSSPWRSWPPSARRCAGAGGIHGEHRHERVLPGVQERRALLRVQQPGALRPPSSNRARPASASRGSASGRTAKPSSPTTRPRSSCSCSSTGSPPRCRGRSRPAARHRLARRQDAPDDRQQLLPRDVEPHPGPLHRTTSPTTPSSWPGTENAGDSMGSFRIRRAKFKLEGWMFRPGIEFELQLNWPGRDRQPGRASSRTRTSTGTSAAARSRSASASASTRCPTAGRSSPRRARSSSWTGRSPSDATTRAARPGSRSGARSARTSSSTAGMVSNGNGALAGDERQRQVPVQRRASTLPADRARARTSGPTRALYQSEGDLDDPAPAR